LTENPSGICPLCRTRPANAVPEPEVETLIAANTPGWAGGETCNACAHRFRFARAYMRRAESEGSPLAALVLPTPVRLGASPHYRGRGVTIAFIDAGFYAHPDLVTPRDRIRAYVDITNPGGARRSDLDTPNESSWHGMMTSVVACGNGSLSGGLYRGIASEADLVLVKAGSAHRVRHDDIRRSFDWVVKNHKRLGIRVVNVSVGGDYEASYLDDGLSESVERATRAGLLVCSAAGNSGHLENHVVLPPGSAPSALTVGGLNDQNRLTPSGFDMYRSSYGPTIDGLQKPEVIAPGIWVAAPILPGTTTAQQAQLLSTLIDLPDLRLKDTLTAHPGVDPELDAAAVLPAPALRQIVALKLRDGSVLSNAYKHVDGTSFASPIVASVAAQMIEANPTLTPLDVKGILVRSAQPIPGVAAMRQGFGVIDPRSALHAALRAGRERSTAPANDHGPTPTRARMA
jgi:serine protease AprX